MGSTRRVEESLQDENIKKAKKTKKAKEDEDFLTILAAQDEATARKNAKKEVLAEISFDKLQKEELSKLFIEAFNSNDYGIRDFQPAGKECKVNLVNYLSFSVKVETSKESKKDKFVFTSDKSNICLDPDDKKGKPQDTLMIPDNVKLFVIMFRQTMLANGRKYPCPIFIKTGKPNSAFEKALKAAFEDEKCTILNEKPSPRVEDDAKKAAKNEPTKGKSPAPVQKPTTKGDNPDPVPQPVPEIPDLPSIEELEGNSNKPRV